jgi:hypothetical protein
VPEVDAEVAQSGTLLLEPLSHPGVLSIEPAVGSSTCGNVLIDQPLDHDVVLDMVSSQDASECSSEIVLLTFSMPITRQILRTSHVAIRVQQPNRRSRAAHLSATKQGTPPYLLTRRYFQYLFYHSDQEKR